MTSKCGKNKKVAHEAQPGADQLEHATLILTAFLQTDLFLVYLFFSEFEKAVPLQ